MTTQFSLLPPSASKGAKSELSLSSYHTLQCTCFLRIQITTSRTGVTKVQHKVEDRTTVYAVNFNKATCQRGIIAQFIPVKSEAHTKIQT